MADIDAAEIGLYSSSITFVTSESLSIPRRFLSTASSLKTTQSKTKLKSAHYFCLNPVGITLLALAGNMWNNAGQSSDERVGNVAKVMCVSATALGVLTLLIPGDITWFSYLYAAVGFGFGLAYLFNLVRK